MRFESTGHFLVKIHYCVFPNEKKLHTELKNSFVERKKNIGNIGLKIRT